jgi:hypothetical protein
VSCISEKAELNGVIYKTDQEHRGCVDDEPFGDVEGGCELLLGLRL